VPVDTVLCRYSTILDWPNVFHMTFLVGKTGVAVLLILLVDIAGLYRKSAQGSGIFRVSWLLCRPNPHVTSAVR
jgi:hypothetical protein